MIEIRPACIDDLRAVLALWAEADAEPTITDNQGALRQLLGHASEALLVALEGDNLVGSLIVGWDGWRGSFYRLAVAHESRRRGVARQLVAEGEDRLRTLGARRIAPFAVADEKSVIAFWEACGYTPQSNRQRLVKNLVS